MIKAVAGDTTRHDFAFFGLELHQGISIFEIDVTNLGLAETTNFGLCSRATTATLSLLTLHENPFK